MLHMKAAHHVFQEALKPQMLKQARVGYLSAISQDTAKTMRTIQSYLHSIADPEWAAALAHKIAQEIPTGTGGLISCFFEEGLRLGCCG